MANSGVPGFTIELGNAFFEQCAAFESAIAPDNIEAMLYAAKVVRTPYLTPAGPEAIDVTLPAVTFVAGEVAESHRHDR